MRRTSRPWATKRRPRWWAPQHASMATTLAGSFVSRATRPSRRTRRRSTTAPAASSPTRLQLFLPRSTPMIVTSLMSHLSGYPTRVEERGGPFHKGGRAGQALGRSRGGFSTKIHLKTDWDGDPLGFCLTGGRPATARTLRRCSTSVPRSHLAPPWATRAMTPRPTAGRPLPRHLPGDPLSHVH